MFAAPANSCQSQIVLIGASTCRPRTDCCVTKLNTLAPAPKDSATAIIATLVITAPTTTCIRARTEMRIAASRVAGQTLIHVATVRTTAAARGRVAISSTPTIASGTVIESMRPSAIGPRSSRNATHHQATPVLRRKRPHPVSTPKATRSSTSTRLSQVLGNSSGPKTRASSIGTSATIG